MKKEVDVERLWTNMLDVIAISNWPKVPECANKLQAWLDSGGAPPRVTGNFRLSDLDHLLATTACTYARNLATEKLKGQKSASPRKKRQKGD